MKFRTQLFLNKVRERRDAVFGFLFKLKNPKNKKVAVAVSVLLVVATLGLGFFAYAGVEEIIGSIGSLIGKAVAYILYGVAYGIGWIVMQVFKLVIMVSSYQDFVNSPAVNKGWVLMRDMVNMVLVIILLVYAFATILQVKKYSEKRILPRILITAVLVNFSKLIVALFIDVGQVFMLTFVNGYAATAGANIINGLGLVEILSTTGAKAKDVTDWFDIITFLMFSIFFLIATGVIVFWIAALLAFRIAVLWILIVLSPLGFLAMTQFPKVADQAQQWWSELFNWVLLGPLMAFFLWLSLLIMSDPKNIDQSGKMDQTVAEAAKAGDSDKSGPALAVTNRLATATISLAMLYGSVYIARKMGGDIGAGIASRAKATSLKWAAGATGISAVRTGFNVASGQQAPTGAVTRRIARAREGVIGGVKKVATVPFSATGGAVKGVFRGVQKGGQLAAGKAQEKGGGKLAQGVAAIGGAMAGMAASPVTALVGAGQQLKSKNFMAAGATNKAKGQQIIQEGVKDSMAKMAGFDNDQLREKMNTGAFTETRQAAAQMLADRKELDGEKDEDAIRAISQSFGIGKGPGGENELLSKPFKEAVGKKNPHAVYETGTEVGRKELSKAIESNDVDLSKVSKSALRDEQFMGVARGSLGANYGKKLQEAAETSPVMEAEVTALLETKIPQLNLSQSPEPKRASFAKGPQGEDTYQKARVPFDTAQGERKAYANVSGKIQLAYNDDQGMMTKHLQKSKQKDLSKIYGKMKPAEVASASDAHGEALGSSMTVGKIRNLSRSEDGADAANNIKDILMKQLGRSKDSHSLLQRMASNPETKEMFSPAETTKISSTPPPLPTP